MVILALIFGFFTNSIAQNQTKSVKAHAHGVSTWSLAFDGKTGKLMVDTPAESILGFEYEPKKKKDVLKVSANLQKFEQAIPKMIVIPDEYSCVWTKKTLEVIREENNKNHCEVEAEFEINCQKILEGAEIKFYIQKYFPKFHSVNAEILFGNIQKSLPANRIGVSVFLK